MRACLHFPKGKGGPYRMHGSVQVDRTVHTEAYISYVLHIPSGSAWKDLGTN